MITNIKVLNTHITTSKFYNKFNTPLYYSISDILRVGYDCHIAYKNLLIYHTKEAEWEKVDNEILVAKSHWMALIDWPSFVQSRLRKWDKTYKMTPFEFELEIDERFLR